MTMDTTPDRKTRRRELARRRRMTRTTTPRVVDSRDEPKAPVKDSKAVSPEQRSAEPRNLLKDLDRSVDSDTRHVNENAQRIFAVLDSRDSGDEDDLGKLLDNRPHTPVTEEEEPGSSLCKSPVLSVGSGVSGEMTTVHANRSKAEDDDYESEYSAYSEDTSYESLDVVDEFLDYMESTDDDTDTRSDASSSVRRTRKTTKSKEKKDKTAFSTRIEDVMSWVGQAREACQDMVVPTTSATQDVSTFFEEIWNSCKDLREKGFVEDKSQVGTTSMASTASLSDEFSMSPSNVDATLDRLVKLVAEARHSKTARNKANLVLNDFRHNHPDLYHRLVAKIGNEAVQIHVLKHGEVDAVSTISNEAMQAKARSMIKPAASTDSAYDHVFDEPPIEDETPDDSEAPSSPVIMDTSSDGEKVLDVTPQEESPERADWQEFAESPFKKTPSPRLVEEPDPEIQVLESDAEDEGVDAATERPMKTPSPAPRAVARSSRRTVSPSTPSILRNSSPIENLPYRAPTPPPSRKVKFATESPDAVDASFCLTPEKDTSQMSLSVYGECSAEWDSF